MRSVFRLLNVVLMRLPETIVSLCGLEGCVQPAGCTAAIRSRIYVSEHAQVLQRIRSCMIFFRSLLEIIISWGSFVRVVVKAQ